MILSFSSIGEDFTVIMKATKKKSENVCQASLMINSLTKLSLDNVCAGQPCIPFHYSYST